MSGERTNASTSETAVDRYKFTYSLDELEWVGRLQLERVAVNAICDLLRLNRIAFKLDVDLHRHAFFHLQTLVRGRLLLLARGCLSCLGGRFLRCGLLSCRFLGRRLLRSGLWALRSRLRSRHGLRIFGLDGGFGLWFGLRFCTRRLSGL